MGEATRLRDVGPCMSERERPRVHTSLPPTRSALLAPFVVVHGQLADLSSRPLPFLGGVFGSLLGCAALAAALLWAPSPAAADEDSSFHVEFVAASAVSLDSVETADTPEVSEPDTPDTPDTEVDDVVSEAAENATPPNPKPKPTPKPKPDPNPSPAPTPPAPGPDNPFTEQGAWTDLVAEGDPWAAAVLAALRSMQVPAWAGQIDSQHPYGFRIRVCTKGSIDKVYRKQSTGDPSLDQALAYEIERLKLPPIPASIRETMTKRCMVLDYNFSWSTKGVG